MRVRTQDGFTGQVRGPVTIIDVEAGESATVVPGEGCHAFVVIVDESRPLGES